MAKDAERDCHLADLGLTVLRFSAREVFENTEGVLERIFERLPNPP
jgi:very-short-patch-repair endonuclease